MTGRQEDEEVMNKEHQFWIKEHDTYKSCLDEEKRYGPQFEWIYLSLLIA